METKQREQIKQLEPATEEKKHRIMEDVVPPNTQSLVEFFMSIGLTDKVSSKALVICKRKNIADVDSLLYHSQEELQSAGFTLGVIQKLRQFLNAPISHEELTEFYEKIKVACTQSSRELKQLTENLDACKKKVEDKIAERDKVLKQYEDEIAQLEEETTRQKETLKSSQKNNSQLESLLKMPPIMLVSNSTNVRKFLTDKGFQCDWDAAGAK